jgi:mono/diheme cytochrome c family protein
MTRSLPRSLTRSSLACLTLAAVAVLTTAAPEKGAGKLEYNRDIRPILAENCFACHGPDSAARKAKLRLDVREEAIQAGAVTPGSPEKSALIERIFSEDANDRMPPVKSRKSLTAAQKALLKKWIAEGAEYQPHWAYIPPQRPTPPQPQGTGRNWVRNPIDQFVLAELEKRGLRPAPEADRRTLARRLSLDLTGLPPTPEEVERFVNDTRSDAYERYVDELMKSPHWGEHRGRIWLDAARYADTHGIHFDNFREMWAYRDWVIYAFNRNLPFDQFTIEQLAGDLLPNRTLDQQIASGFNRCNITTNEGGVIAEEYLVLYTRDRTETVSQVWLGTTAGCAVCHDHKFDPLSQREFYEMAAFFNNTTQGAMDRNIKDTPPIVQVPRPEDRPRMEELKKLTVDHQRAIENRKSTARPEFDQWLASASIEQVAVQIPVNGMKLHARLGEGEGQTVQVAVADKVRPITLDSGFEWGAGKLSPKAFTLRPARASS